MPRKADGIDYQLLDGDVLLSGAASPFFVVVKWINADDCVDRF